MSRRIDFDQHHIDVDDVTDFVHEATRMEILDLPTDVLILILSLLHGQDIARCMNVCRSFAEVVRSDLYLLYKIELAQIGMVNGDSSALCVSERLKRLQECSSRFRNGTFDYEDLTVHLHHTYQMSKVRWNTTTADESSLSILHGLNVNFPTFRHSQDELFDLFLTISTPGAAQLEAGIRSSRSMVRIGIADEYTAFMTRWAIDGAQDLLVLTEIANIAVSEPIQLMPDDFNIRFYSLSGSKTAGELTPHPAATLPSIRVSAPDRTYGTQPLSRIDEVHISGQHVVWALGVETDDGEIRTVTAVFIGVCNWRTGKLISLMDVGRNLVHAIPLDFPYILLVPKAFQTYPHLAIYDFSQADIHSHHLCTLLLPDEDSNFRDDTEEAPWYQVRFGDRPQTFDGYFHADLSQSMVVLTFYHVYPADNSERDNHYLIPRATLLAQCQAAKSRQAQTQLRTPNGGATAGLGAQATVPVVPWADWGPQGCLRLSLRCRQAYRASPMPFGSRFPLFVVDKADPRNASVYVFDVNPLVARYERQRLATRPHPDPSHSNATSGDPVTRVTGMVVEDIEAVLPGLVDRDCSRIPYIAYRFQLPGALMDWQEGEFIGRVVMGMTGFTIKMVGGQYEKAEQTWTV